METLISIFYDWNTLLVNQRDQLIEFLKPMTHLLGNQKDQLIEFLKSMNLDLYLKEKITDYLTGFCNCVIIMTNFCIQILSYQFVQYLLYSSTFIAMCYFLDTHSRTYFEKHTNTKKDHTVYYNTAAINDVNIDDVTVIGLTSNHEVGKNTVCRYLKDYHDFVEIEIKEILIEITQDMLNIHQYEIRNSKYILNWFWEKNQTYTSLDMRDKLFDSFRKIKQTKNSNYEIMMNAFKRKIKEKKDGGYTRFTQIVVTDVGLYEDYEIIKLINGTIWGIFISDNSANNDNHMVKTNRNNNPSIPNTESNLMFECDTILDIDNMTYSNLRSTIDNLVDNL